MLGVFTSLRKEVMPILPKDVQKASQIEQMVNKSCHAIFAIWCMYSYGFAFWMKLHFIPHLFWFPVAFMINRCGQHYRKYGEMVVTLQEKLFDSKILIIRES